MDGDNLFASALQRIWSPLVISFGLVMMAVIFSAIDDTALNWTVTEVLIRVVLVVGIYIFVGNSGILSFGHIGFAAIGAYAVAWQTCCPVFKPLRFPALPDLLLTTTVPLVPAAILAGLLAMVVGFILGSVIMRLTGLAASIATFSFLVIVNSTYGNWDSVTAGTSSVIGIPVYVNIWVALIWALLAIAVAHAYQVSRLGLVLRSSREDEVASRAMGVNVVRQRLIAFTISAFFAGIGGALYAHFLGTLAVNSFYLDLTLITVAMLVVGGMHSLTGAVVGVVVFSGLIEVLIQLEKGLELGGVAFSLPRGAQEIGLAVVMLLILIFRRGGITGNREVPWPFKDRQAIAAIAESQRHD